MKRANEIWFHLAIVLATIGLMTSCGQGTGGGTAGGGNTPAPITPTWKQVANATFTGILSQPITLHDGQYVGEPTVPGSATRPHVRLIEELQPTGDLDGDGVPEAVAVLTADTGGSGTFLHIAPLAVRGGKVQQLGVASLGDRVQIRSIRITDRIIDVRTVEAGPGDAMCCPTQKRQRLFALRDGALTEIATKDEGPLSLDDLAGPEWVLVAFGHAEPAPAEPRVTLHVDAEKGKISGSSGCNRYQGTITSSTPGELEIGPLAGTRRMCPPDAMELEQRFLQALSGATSYRFSFGRLAIDYGSGDTSGTLLFAPQDARATANGAS